MTRVNLPATRRLCSPGQQLGEATTIPGWRIAGQDYPLSRLHEAWRARHGGAPYETDLPELGAALETIPEIAQW